jgi:hypothetical protein
LHYLNPLTDNFNYRIKANDTLNNQAFSSWYWEIVDFENAFPSAVSIISPIESLNYSTTITISHTNAITPSGSILYYKYDYRIANSTSYINIGNNTYPTTTFLWDISALINTYYQIRITVYTSGGLSSITLSDEFYINNPLSSTEELLNNINNNLITSNSLTNNIYKVISMIGIVLIFVVLLIIGIIFNNWLMQIFSGLFSFGLGFIYGIDFNNYLYISTLFIIIGIFMFLYGCVNALNVLFNANNKQDNNKDFYGNMKYK